MFANFYNLFRITSICITAIPIIWMFISLSGSKPSEDNSFYKPVKPMLSKLYIFLSRHYLVLLVLIFAVFLFSRLFRLESIPAGIHLDEIGITYDAFSLKSTGADRAGNAYPVYPSNYGDGNSALYTYLEMMLLYFLPFSLRTVRLPAVIVAIPCFFASLGIVYELFEDRFFSLLGPLFVTITPYFFTSERFGLDCNLMLSTGTVALFFLVKAIKKPSVLFYFLAGTFFGITLYTYILSYLMLPIFIVLIIGYLAVLRKAPRHPYDTAVTEPPAHPELKKKDDYHLIKEVAALVIPFGLLGIPLFLEQLVNMGIMPEFHFLMSDFHKLSNYRIGEISAKNIPGNLLVILKLVFGGDTLGFNALYEFGPLYWCSVPLIITGLVSAVKKMKLSFKEHIASPVSIFILFGLSVYFVTLLLSSFNTYNSNPIYIVFIVLAIEGIDFVLKAKIPDKIRYLILASSFVLIFISFLLFSEFYFRRQIDNYGFHAAFVSTEPGDIIKYSDSIYNPSHNKTIYTEINYSERDYADILIALYTETDPAVWHKYEEEKQNDPTNTTLNNIAFSFPEEFDESEDAIYILGTDWGHIASYLRESGFNADTSFQGYTILYK